LSPGSSERYFSWWAGRSILDISFGTVEDWSHWLAQRPALDRRGRPTERPLSPTTRRKALGAFHSFVAWLYRRGDLPTVPPFPTVKPVPYEPPIISAATQDAILGEIPWERRGVFLAATCGMCPGEIRALNVGDYFEDTDGAWLWIDKAMQGSNANARLGPIKTRQTRSAAISAELHEWIRWRRDQVGPEERLRGPVPLFVNPTARNAERRWIANALREEWKRAAGRVGVYGVPMYPGTKHATATDALRRGVPLEKVQELLGHSDARSTLRYAKLAKRAALDVLRRPACSPARKRVCNWLG
jgi:integrase